VDSASFLPGGLIEGQELFEDSNLRKDLIWLKIDSDHESGKEEGVEFLWEGEG
jgi:hypothetical protein